MIDVMAEKIEMEDSNSDTKAIQITQNPKARKLRSLVWNDFSKEQTADGQYVAICNHCKKQLTASSRSGTTHLKNHLGTCLSSKKPMKRKKLVVRRLIMGSYENLKLEGKNEDPANPDGSEFDQESTRYDLARMILLHGYPFSIVEHVGFRTFVRNLQPRFNMVSFETIKADCMKIYSDARLKLQEALSKLPCRISLSIDMWNSSDDMNYLCLTCSYVDDDWKLQRKILSFFHADASSASEKIGKQIMKKLKVWDIHGALSGITLDNCTNSDAVAKHFLESLGAERVYFQGLFHVSSCQHILNVIVEDSLDPAYEIIERVRSSMQAIRSSQELPNKFSKSSKSFGTRQKPIIPEVSSHWTLTYLMLQSACEYQEALSSTDWNDVKALVGCLEAFYSAIEKISNAPIPTANLFFNHLCFIHLLIKSWLMSPQPVIVSVASRMLEKFEEHWGITKIVMALASVLDPRYKMKSIEYFYDKIYPSESKERIEFIRSTLISLYNEYVRQSNKKTGNQAYFCYVGTSSAYSGNEYGMPETKSSNRFTMSDMKKGLDQYLQETSSSQPVRTDLDLYLEEGVHPSKDGLDDNFNILAWWKFNAAKYPVLAIMARDLLAIPVSFVSLESEGRTLNQYLSSLDPETIEGLICAQDWLKDDGEASNVVEGDFALALVPSNKDDYLFIK